MRTKKSGVLSQLFIAGIAPFIFACASANTEEVADGYFEQAAPGEEVTTEALVEDIAFEEAPSMQGYELAEQATPELEAKIAEAQAAVEQEKPAPVVTPYMAPAPPKVATVKKVQQPKAEPKPVAEALPQAVVRNGSTLNRFYFARKGDTAESVAELVYGSTDRAAEIVGWNGPTENWVAGAPLYYRSEAMPEDKNLVSYYFEKGIASEEVVAEAGEDLKDIALRRYGSADSWPELAAASGIRGYSITPGMAIKAYPHFKNAPAIEEKVVAQNPEPTRQPAAVVKPKTRAQMASAQVMDFVRTKPLITSAALLAIFLAASYMFVQRRRQRSRFDF